jgi:hypothetical protein
MKQFFGVGLARSCLLSMHWIVANHKREGVVAVSIAKKTCRPMDAATIELPNRPVYAIEGEHLHGSKKGPIPRRRLSSCERTAKQ